MESTLDKKLLKEFYLESSFGTRAVHAGEHLMQPGKPISHVNAIYQSSTFVFESAQDGKDLFAAHKEGYIYSRLGNPTVIVFEAKMNALEGQELKMRDPDNTRISSLAFASGMAAISATILGVMQQGETILRGDTLYGCTNDFFRTVLPRFGINSVSVDTADLSMFRKVMEKNADAKMLYFETPTNPTMKITDIAEVSAIAKEINPDILIVVDNTFCTPYLQTPLSLGADVVVHSTTKYIGGHGVLVGGISITHSDYVKDQLFHMIKDIGSCPSPFDTWLANMGLKTLPLRMDKICKNAMEIARFLESHPKVATVHYPGLPGNTYHETAKKQMRDFGGMISFEVKGSHENVEKILNNTHLFSLAVSLGGVDSLIQHPATMTHASVPEEEKMKTGITPGLIRISVGIEDVEDLIKDLEQAMN